METTPTRHKGAAVGKKPRLFSRKKVKMPRPPLKLKSDRGFSLRTINESDGRFHVVKQMRERVAQLMSDCNADTIAKTWMCGRAVFLNGYLESQEIEAIEGVREMDWRTYLQAVRALSDVLNKLGLDKAVAGAKRLEDYIHDARKSKNGKHKSAT